MTSERRTGAARGAILAIGGLCAALVWLLAGPMAAQEARKYGVAETAQIVKLAEGSVTVERDGGEMQRFRVDDATEISGEHDQSELADLRIGDRVVIEGRSGLEFEKADTPTADRIRVVVVKSEGEQPGSEPLQPISEDE